MQMKFEEAITFMSMAGYDNDVDKLETQVKLYQESASLGEPIVTDAVYDLHVSVLKVLKPSSELLKGNWETYEEELDEDGDDVLLKKVGMSSIRTVTGLSELWELRDRIGDNSVSVLASLKLNGHAARAVYRYGRFVKGTSRGRAEHSRGKDFTFHFQQILPQYIEQLKDVSIAEVRLEVLCSYDNFEKIRHYVKTPLSAVTSLTKPSATVQEAELLDGCAYRIISNELEFSSLEEEYEALIDMGFKVPEYRVVDGIDYYNFEQKVSGIVDFFDKFIDDNGYWCDTDGIVVCVNSAADYEILGTSGKNDVAKFALKMGKHWELNTYSSKILEIIVTPNKKHMVPKARIEPVVTRNMSTVEFVPLHNVGVMEKYGLVPGSEIYFRYGGETGVSLTNELGELIGELNKGER